jgi:hypothetical protein
VSGLLADIPFAMEGNIVCGSNVDVHAYHRWVGAAPTAHW